MNKHDYLGLLRYYLKDLPTLIVDDIIYDYDEHFNVGIESGKTEEQISEELGSPDDIAKEYLGTDIYKKRRMQQESVEEIPRPKESDNIAKWIVLGLVLLLLSPLIIGIFGALVGVIIRILGATLGGGVGLIGAGIGLLFSLLDITGTFFGAHYIVISPITRVLASIFLMALGVLLIGLGFTFIKFVIKGLSDLYKSARWKLRR